MRLNPVWIRELKEKASAFQDPGDGTHVDYTLTLNAASKYVIYVLANRNIPFKVYNLGAGVKRITTDTDKCPCCKKKL